MCQFKKNLTISFDFQYMLTIVTSSLGMFIRRQSPVDYPPLSLFMLTLG